MATEKFTGAQTDSATSDADLTNKPTIQAAKKFWWM